MADLKQNFSGWSVVLGCFLLSFTAVAIVNNTASLFMEPICSEFGFTTSAYSILNLIGAFASAAGAIFLAPRMQSGNIKLIMIICAVITGLAFMAMGICRELWQFYIAGGIYNLALSGLNNLPVAMLITAWFNDKRSVAMSLAFCGTGLGTAIWSKLFGAIITEGSWRLCYFIGGPVTIALSIIIVLLFIKKSPELYAQKAYEAPKKENKSGNADKQAEGSQIWKGVEKKLAVRTMPFFMLVVVVFLVGCLAAGVITHLIYYLIGEGWTMNHAASVLALYSIMTLVGYFAGGFLFERLGPKYGTALFCIFSMIGMGALLVARHEIFGYLFAIFFAFSMMMPKMLPAILTSTVFGVKDYSSIYSFLNLFFMLGCALGAVITGVISSSIGYHGAWVLYIVFCAVIILCTFSACAGGKRLEAQYPNPPSS